MTAVTLDQVRAALALPDFDGQAAQRGMAPHSRPLIRTTRSGQPKLAAVLLLLYPIQGALQTNASAELAFALMRRTEYPGTHSGQISLPGGSREADESWEQTAIRETCEEFGVCDGIMILGLLTPLYVPPSDFEIHPVVGTLDAHPTWQPDPREVAQILEVPLRDLLDEHSKRTEERVVSASTTGTMGGITARVPSYHLRDHIVWGATAIILSEFEQRLRAVA